MHGIIPAQHAGVNCSLPGKRLKPVDLKRIVGGQAVRDNLGQVLVDPSADRIEIYTIDKPGRSAVRFESSPESPPQRTILIMIPAMASEYRHTMSAIDHALEQNYGPETVVWIAPDLAGVLHPPARPVTPLAILLSSMGAATTAAEGRASPARSWKQLQVEVL